MKKNILCSIGLHSPFRGYAKATGYDYEPCMKCGHYCWKKEKSGGNFFTILFLSLVAVLLLLCSSCGVSKNKSSKKEDSDSTATTYKEVAETKKKVVRTKEKKDTSTVNETYSDDGVDIVFYADSSADDEVGDDSIVIKKEDGKTTVYPGKRKVKSISDKRESKTKDSTGSSTTIASHTGTNDSTGSKEGGTVHVKTKVEEKTKNKETNPKQFLWFWVGIIAIVLIGYNYYKNKIT